MAAEQLVRRPGLLALALLLAAAAGESVFSYEKFLREISRILWRGKRVTNMRSSDNGNEMRYSSWR